MYDSAAYNSLPSLRSAACLVDDTVRAHLTVPVRKLFLDYNAHEQYGIYRSSTAWKVGHEQTDIVAQYEGQIVPRSYRLYKGAAVLKILGLDQIFGLRCLNEYDPSLSIEFTEGKTNIMLVRGSVLEYELIEALWVFGVDDNDRCHCRKHCWPKKDGHDQDHSCG
ncbi:hypothetical protein T440DRAFT_494225 [Plenodomus tracheiphilus IPT5]|uniref:Uncharacterized protein n=1 Tax=Plenodomus tracheiphilus IPT5 TaxID=1408161 RepID=A0A6A7AMG4_9PLEO|nr:hypothetical protein T440DRAFT_494225 [Plenodomus tracheiphilus IPT5]